MTRHMLRAAALLAVCGAAGAALGAGAASGPLLRAELDILGPAASGAWQAAPAGRTFDQIGGQGIDDPPDEIGGSGGEQPQQDQSADGPSNTGDKVKAGALSLVLPGAGQFYNRQNSKAYIMVGVEVAIWTTYFVFDNQGDNRMEASRDWADIYAGTQGSHDDSWWQAVGRYMESRDYDDERRREARALGEDYPPPLSGNDTWLWVNQDRRTGYQKLRADGNSAYDRRDFMILFAVINRAVSVVDAVIGAGAKPGVLETAVLGMNLEVGMLPSWRNPGARCAFSRAF